MKLHDFFGQINNPVIAPSDYSQKKSSFLPGLECRGVGCLAPFCSCKPYALIHGIYRGGSYATKIEKSGPA